MYDLINWVDHKVDQETGVVIEQGTLMGQNNLNKMDRGIFEAIEIGSEASLAAMHSLQAVEKLSGEVIAVSLTNTYEYPFNNSKKTVALGKRKNSSDYLVQMEILSPATAQVGDIVITDKAVNGFKLEYTGSAAAAQIKCIVRGV